MALRSIHVQDDAPGAPPEAAASARAPTLIRPALPRAVAADRDLLFTDADRHAPRAGSMVVRLAPAIAAVVAALMLAAAPPWRELLMDGAGSLASMLLVFPVAAALVVAIAAGAPLARARTVTLIGAAIGALALATWSVHAGFLVAAVVPGAIGSAALGLAAARAVRRSVWVLPALVAAGLSDIHSVRTGVTQGLLAAEAGGSRAGIPSGAPAPGSIVAQLAVPSDAVQRLDYLVLHLPAASGVWVLGLVDIAAIALLLALSHLHWVPLGRSAAAVAVGLAAALVMPGAVPVLPFVAVAWIIVHARLVWRATRFSARRLLYLGG